jgi:hypothetical protein
MLSKYYIYIEKIRKKIILILLYSITFLILFVLLVKYFQKNTQNDDNKIAKHLEELKTIFYNIDKDCKIINIKGKKNNINFLNTISFKGHQVGPLILENPLKWKGPYLNNNYEIQYIEYQIIKTKYGIFITPGEGVKLSNGKIIGENINIKETDNEYNIKAQLRIKGKNLFFKLK